MLSRPPYARLRSYSCMYQAPRSFTQDIEFQEMLPNINLLYLGCKVLILLDMSCE